MSGDSSLPPILITDDESEDRFFLGKSLRRAGVKNPILEFPDGADLIRYLERQSTDRTLGQVAAFLFIDLKMPLMDGIDTMKWIREHPIVSLLRIVVVSSSNHPGDRERASKLGAIGYLEKYPSPLMLSRVLAAPPPSD